MQQIDGDDEGEGGGGGDGDDSDTVDKATADAAADADALVADDDADGDDDDVDVDLDELAESVNPLIAYAPSTERGRRFVLHRDVAGHCAVLLAGRRPAWLFCERDTLR
jgi:hypothetical protein